MSVFSWIFLFAAAESLHAKLESCVDILCSIADVTYLFFANDTLTWVETHHLLGSYPADLIAIILFSTHNQFSTKMLGRENFKRLRVRWIALALSNDD